MVVSEGEEGFGSDYEDSRDNIFNKGMGLCFAFGKQSPPPLRSSYSPQKMIYLESDEGDRFEVEETVALESQAIRVYLENDPYEKTMPFRISSEIMPKVIDYLKRHVDVEAKPEDLKKFDAEFVKVDFATHNKLYWASISLECKSLHDLLIKTNLDMKTHAKQEMKEMKALGVFGLEEEEIVSRLLSAASTQHHPQNDAEMLKLTNTHPQNDAEMPKLISGENTVTKNRKEKLSKRQKAKGKRQLQNILSSIKNKTSILRGMIKGKSQKAATKEEEEEE